MISERIQNIGLSPTLRINALAQELRASGVDVLDLSAGQPDFPTPASVADAGRRAIEAGHTRYTANNGMVEFRQAIADRIKRDHGLTYEADRVLVSPGGKASLYFAFMTLLDPGDEVLLPTPYWVSYPEQIRLTQAVPVLVPCHEDDGFKPSVAALEAAVTPRTKLLVLNYPSNPTGACFERSELEAIAEFCVRHDLRVVADEIYSRLLFDGRRFTSIAELGPEMLERTVMINGMSKTYAMTGWRLGYAAGPKEIISGMSRLQSHSTSNATSISQWAGMAAFEVPDAELDRRRDEFQQRRDIVVAALRAMHGVRCVEPEGSFYVFPNISGCFTDAIRSAEALSGYLLETARVAVVPGEGFGSSDHVRLSFAVSSDLVREGMQRIAAALESL